MNANPTPGEVKLGTTLYSFTAAFHAREATFEQLVAMVAQLGVGPGLELVGFQSIRGFPAISDEFADRFRELMARHRLEPSCLSANADTGIRRGQMMNAQEAADYLEPQIRAAAKLGFPVVKTQFAAPAESMRLLLPLIEKLQIKVGPEIHAPLGVDSAPVMAYRELYAQVNSPFLGFVPDFGTCAKTLPASYLEILRRRGVEEQALDLAVSIWKGSESPQWKRDEFNRRAAQLNVDPSKASALSVMFSMLSPHKPQSWLEIMPQIIHLHGKFYDFDAHGDESSIPYGEILPLFVQGGYRGYMSSEWEGHLFAWEAGYEQVRQHHRLCGRILAAL